MEIERSGVQEETRRDGKRQRKTWYREVRRTGMVYRERIKAVKDGIRRCGAGAGEGSVQGGCGR